MPKSESRYYEDREYQCLGEWSEQVQQSGPATGDKTLTYTYIYVKRVDPGADGTAVYECFVVTTIANDPGQNTETTTTILLTEAGTGTRCSRQADPYMSGMKLVGTKTRDNARNVAEKQSQPPPFMVFFVSFAILVAVPGFIHMNS